MKNKKSLLFEEKNRKSLDNKLVKNIPGIR